VRTCFYGLEHIVERYQNGEKAPSNAAALGISVRTVYKWLKRFQDTDQSSKPQSVNNLTGKHT